MRFFNWPICHLTILNSWYEGWLLEFDPSLLTPNSPHSTSFHLQPQELANTCTHKFWAMNRGATSIMREIITAICNYGHYYLLNNAWENCWLFYFNDDCEVFFHVCFVSVIMRDEGFCEENLVKLLEKVLKILLSITF